MPQDSDIIYYACWQLQQVYPWGWPDADHWSFSGGWVWDTAEACRKFMPDCQSGWASTLLHAGCSIICWTSPHSNSLSWCSGASSPPDQRAYEPRPAWSAPERKRETRTGEVGDFPEWLNWKSCISAVSGEVGSIVTRRCPFASPEQSAPRLIF